MRSTPQQRGVILAMSNTIGLSVDERHDLAEYLTGESSLTRMTDRQAADMIVALRGFQGVLSLLEARPRVRAMLAARAAL
jgi:hypothetical protein